MKKSVLIFISFFCFLTRNIFSQEVLSYSGNDNYTLVERTNLRRYDNGKYTGLLSREVRSFLTMKKTSGGNIRYTGDFFIEQDTVKNSKVMFNGIHDAIPSSFFIDRSGAVTMEDDNGYPSFRSFPSFPNTTLTVGDSWKGTSSRAIDPLNNGIITKIPMTVQYTYEGKEFYHDEEVYKLNAQWATRYGISYWDFGGDKELKSAQGSHKATIFVSCETGAMVFMTDTVDETFIYTNGAQITYKGNILQFTEYPPAVSHDELIPALKRIGVVALGDKASQTEKIAKSDTNAQTSKEIRSSQNVLDSKNVLSSKNTQDSQRLQATKNAQNSQKVQSSKNAQDDKNTLKDSVSEVIVAELKPEDLGEKKITMEETDSGIKLSIHDLKFKADSAELLPGEESRLEEIATVLKIAGNCKLLIEGYTADTGYPAGELKVSRDRAYAIAEALTKRGIDPGRFICKGNGASNPVASNATPEGKALNRRVEITILERNK
ncbi:MAG: OmpA family protein [Treponema sp.]|nr:OmpA family protein [Treponema sp.]